MNPVASKMLVKCVFAVIRWMQTVNEFLLTSLFSVIHRTPKPLPPITDELLLRSATSLAAQIRTGQLKSAVLVERYMARLRAVQPVINAVVEDRFEEAMDEARAADRLVASGEVSPEQLAREKPFLGVPLTTKDCYAVKGMLQDSGLVARAGFRAPADADGMALMRAAGAIPLAVTNVPELCMWWESYNNLHGRTNNPYDGRRICGGSSGGEGSLIASAGSVIGIGTDIGGSIRIPAFFNGIFGHKPTTGLVSNKGQYPPARDDSLDACLVAGPMCRYAEDLPAMLAVMAGDNRSLVKLDAKAPSPFVLQAVTDTGARSKIGRKLWCLHVVILNFVSEMYFSGGFYRMEFQDVASVLRKLGPTYLPVPAVDGDADYRVSDGRAGGAISRWAQRAGDGVVCFQPGA